MCIDFKALDDINYKKVSKLAVYEDQLPYVGSVKANIDISSGDKSKKFFVIQKGELVIGAFCIDIDYSSSIELASDKDLGLRSYLIDKEFQGKGYGKEACIKLKSFLQINFQNHNRILLTVNCKNKKAFAIYCASGFVNSNKIYYGGRAGPQHLLEMDY